MGCGEWISGDNPPSRAPLVRLTSACVASQAGELLTVEGETAVLWLWRSLTHPVPEKLVSHVTQVTLNTPIVAFSPDGSLLACSCRESGASHVIKVFNITTSQLLKNFPADVSVTHLSFIDDSHLFLRSLCRTGLALEVVALRNCVNQAHSVESKFVYHHNVLLDHYFIPTNMTKTNTLYTLKFHM